MSCEKKKIIPFFPPKGEGLKPLVEERLEINILSRSNKLTSWPNHLTAVTTANNNKKINKNKNKK